MSPLKNTITLAVAGTLIAVSGAMGGGVARADTALSNTEASQPVEAQGEIVLTLDLYGEETHMTLQDLQALGDESFDTATIWTTGPQRFTGVSLATLVAGLSLSSEMIEAQAVNDYSVQIPLSDAVQGGPIIAYKRNGKTMSLRGKGPLWLVYPYDSNPAYRTEAVYSRSIWQLDRLTVKSATE